MKLHTPGAPKLPFHVVAFTVGGWTFHIICLYGLQRFVPNVNQNILFSNTQTSEHCSGFRYHQRSELIYQDIGLVFTHRSLYRHFYVY
jgi:hypothetical protein